MKSTLSDVMNQNNVSFLIENADWGVESESSIATDIPPVTTPPPAPIPPPATPATPAASAPEKPAVDPQTPPANVPLMPEAFKDAWDEQSTDPNTPPATDTGKVDEAGKPGDLPVAGEGDDPTKKTTEEKAAELNFVTIGKVLAQQGWLGEVNDQVLEEYREATGQEFELNDESLKFLYERNQQLQINEKLEAIASTHGAFGQQLFEEVFVKGVDPFALLEKYQQRKDLMTLDPTKTHEAEQIVRMFFARSGMSDEAINDEIESLKDAAILETKAGKYKPQLDAAFQREKEEAVRQQQLAAQQVTQQKAAYDAQVRSLLNTSIKNKSIDGIPVSEKKVHELYNFMNDESLRYQGQTVTPLYVKMQEVIADPVRYTKLAYLLMSDLNVEVIESQAKSKVTESIFQRLTQNTSQSSKEEPKKNTKTPVQALKEMGIWK